MIPTVAFTSIARGYFMGVQQMGKIATANALKKSFSSSACFYFFNGIPLNWILLFSFHCLSSLQVKWSCLFICFRSLFWSGVPLKRAADPLAEKRCFKTPAHCFDPDDGAARVSCCDKCRRTFLVKGTLLAAGVSRTSAIDQFGMLSGVAMTIGFFRLLSPIH